METKYTLAGVVALVAIAAIVLLVISQSGMFVLGTEKQEIVRIGNLPTTHGLPLYIALDNNYFEEAGIKVELTRFEAPNQLVDAILQDKIDFSATGPAGIVAVASYRSPGKIKFFSLAGSTAENPRNSFLLVPNNSTINSIPDLNGKKLGIWGGSIQWRTIAIEILAQNGLIANKDVVLVELAPATQVPAFAAGQLDALLALEPIATTITQKKLGKIIESAPAEKYVADPFYPGIGVVNMSFAEKNPELAKKVIKVIERAIKDIQNNEDAQRIHLKGYTPFDGNVLEGVTLQTFVTCKQITAKDLNGLQKFFDIFTKNKVIDGRVDVYSLNYCS